MQRGGWIPPHPLRWTKCITTRGVQLTLPVKEDIPLLSYPGPFHIEEEEEVPSSSYPGMWGAILSVNFEHKIEGNGGELTELCYSQQRGPKSWVLPWSQLALMGVEYVAGVVVVVGGCHGRIHFCGDGHNSPSPRHQLIVVACCPPWTWSWWCDWVQTLTMSLLMSKIQRKSMWFLGDSLLKY